MLTSGLVPHAILGVTAVLAMLLAPRGQPWLVRGVAAIGLATTAVLVLLRVSAPPAPALPLFADDGLARFGALLASMSGLVVLGFIPTRTMAREGPALICIVALGAAALAAAGHVASLFLGLEIVSLALIALFVLPMTRNALEAGYKYLLPGAAGSAALLLGAALAYAGSGKLDLTAWHEAGGLTAAATALLLVGLGFKLSLVPFHLWAPDIYEGAPPAAAAIAGSAAKVAVVIAVLRIDATVPAAPVWSTGLAALAAASIVLGNLAALRQPSLPRMIGYSSVGHSGYLVAMIVCGASREPAAILFYLAAYVPAVLAALCVASSAPATIDSLRGLIWRRPLAGGVLTVALVSLAGLPIAVGFLAKLLLIGALVRSSAWLLLGSVVLGSALGLYVYFRFVTVLFARDDRAAVAGAAPSLPDRAVLLVCGGLLLMLGVYPTPLFDYLELAAR